MGAVCSTPDASPDDETSADCSHNQSSTDSVVSAPTVSTFETTAAAAREATPESHPVSLLHAVSDISTSDLCPSLPAQPDTAEAPTPRLARFVPITSLPSELASVEASTLSESTNSSQLRLEETGSFRSAVVAAASAPAKSTLRQVSFTFALRFDEHNEEVEMPRRGTSSRPSDAPCGPDARLVPSSPSAPQVKTPLASTATVVPLTPADAKHRVQQAVPKSTPPLPLRAAARSHCASPQSPKRDTGLSFTHRPTHQV